MITARFLLDSDGNITGFDVAGHSGYGEVGTDIVCAAVSSAVWMTVNGLENVAGVKVGYSSADADVICRLDSSKDNIQAGQVLLESFRQLMDDLSNQYENYLTVKEVI